MKNLSKFKQRKKPELPKIPPRKRQLDNASVLAAPPSSASFYDPLIQQSPLERAKSIIFSRISASLISITSVPENEDEGEAEEKFLVPYVMHPSWPGHPIVAMEGSESHCANLMHEAKCAMTVLSLTPSRIDYTKIPLPRVSSLGDVALIEDPKDIRKIHKAFETVHPGSKDHLEQFKFFEFQLGDVHFVNSCGEYLHFTNKEYDACKTDSLAIHTKHIIDTIGKQRPITEDLMRLCARCSETPLDLIDAFILSTDHLGFNIMACTREIIETGEEMHQWLEIRLPFGHSITTLPEYFLEMHKIFDSEE